MGRKGLIILCVGRLIIPISAFDDSGQRERVAGRAPKPNCILINVPKIRRNPLSEGALHVIIVVLLELQRKTLVAWASENTKRIGSALFVWQHGRSLLHIPKPSQPKQKNQPMAWS